MFLAKLTVSIIRSSSGSILCSLLKIHFKTLSDLFRYVNSVLWQRVLCVLCESYTVRNEPGCGCALCDVQRETVGVVVEFCLLGTDCICRCTVHSAVYVINTPTNANIFI